MHRTDKPDGVSLTAGLVLVVFGIVLLLDRSGTLHLTFGSMAPIASGVVGKKFGKGRCTRLWPSGSLGILKEKPRGPACGKSTSRTAQVLQVLSISPKSAGFARTDESFFRSGLAPQGPFPASPSADRQ